MRCRRIHHWVRPWAQECHRKSKTDSLYPAAMNHPSGAQSLTRCQFEFGFLWDNSSCSLWREQGGNLSIWAANIQCGVCYLTCPWVKQAMARKEQLVTRREISLVKAMINSRATLRTAVLVPGFTWFITYHQKVTARSKAQILIRASQFYFEREKLSHRVMSYSPVADLGA